MTCPSSFLVFKAERQDINATHLLECFGNSLDDQEFTLTWFQRRHLLAERLRAICSKESIHVLFHENVIQPHVDTIIVEEKDTVTSPILKEPIDQFKRKSFI